MRISPDGRVGYITNRSTRALTVLELGTRTSVATIPMPASPRFIAFGRNGTRAYVSCYDGTGARSQVAVVNTQTYTVTAVIPVDEQPYALAVAPDRRELWVPSHSAGSIDLVNLDTETVTRSVSVAPNPHGVVFAADRAYVVNHESNLVTVLDATDAALLATVPVGRSPHSMALSPDGSRVAVANHDGDTVSVIDTTSNQVSATIPVGQGPQNVAYAPDGRHLYIANVNEGTVSTIDANTNQVTSTYVRGLFPDQRGAGARRTARVRDIAGRGTGRRPVHRSLTAEWGGRAWRRPGRRGGCSRPSRSLSSSQREASARASRRRAPHRLPRRHGRWRDDRLPLPRQPLNLDERPRTGRPVDHSP